MHSYSHRQVKEIKEFESRRRKKMHRRESVHDGEELVNQLLAAEAIVREKLLAALRRVDIFSLLTEEQLELLRDAMIPSPFDEGEYVFEQGDEGDSFYVIVEGRISAIRVENMGTEEEEEKVLAEWGEGAYFGERALLKSQASGVGG
jgi:hypothetical protein